MSYLVKSARSAAGRADLPGMSLNPSLASRAAAFAALAAGATAIGTLAIGWITIRKLRFFAVKPQQPSN
jgi:hypothetical protein